MAMKTLGVRLEPHHYELVQAAAKARGDTISDFARVALIRAAKHAEGK